MEIDPHDVATVVSDLNTKRTFGGPLYYSESKGRFMRIKNMNAVHIRNALRKAYISWVQKIEADSPRQWLIKFKDGPVYDQTIINLMTELSRKHTWSH
jgi:hypothetical protein